MKLDFKKAKRKLFGSSPGKSKKKRGVRSGSFNGLDILCGVLIFAMLTAFTPMLISGIDHITTNKNTTTTTASATNSETPSLPYENVVIKAGTYRFNDVPDFSLLIDTVTANLNFTFNSHCSYGGVDYGDVLFNCDELALTLQTNGTYRIWYNLTNTSVDFSSIGLSFPYQLLVYNCGFYNGLGIFDDLSEQMTITILEDTEVDETFGTWFISNTNYNVVNAPKMTLKAGTYRFNDVLNFDKYYDDTFSINFTANVSLDGVDYYVASCDAMYVYNRENMNARGVGYNVVGITPDVSSIIDVTYPFINPAYKDGGEVYDHDWVTYGAETITLESDQEVDVTFGTWFISNTNYNEVNAAKAAELEVTQTVILNPVVIQYLYCFDLKRNIANMAL